MLRDTFDITSVEELGMGRKKYYFSAEAYREFEFTVYDDYHQPEAEYVSGIIVLDRDFNLVRDEKGRVTLEPWTCINTPGVD